jgi:folate-binding protein YgfZ
VAVLQNIAHQFDTATHDVALIDNSWIGCIEVRGSDRLDLLHRLSTNDLLATRPGQSVDTVFTTDKGRIVDYVHVLVKQDALLLLVSKGNEEDFVRWIDKFTIMEDVKLSIVTPARQVESSTCPDPVGGRESMEITSLFGPRARDAAEKFFGIELKQSSFVEKDGTLVFYCREFCTDLIHVIAEKQSSIAKSPDISGVARMSADAYEVFRISRGIPHYGSELNEAFNPYEIGLTHAISFTKGCYIGQEIIARLDTYKKIQKSTWGIVMSEDSALPQTNARVHFNGEDVGRLTSVSLAAVRGKRVGLAVLKNDTVVADNHISIVSGGNTFDGIAAAIPVTL